MTWLIIPTAVMMTIAMEIIWKKGNPVTHDDGTNTQFQ